MRIGVVTWIRIHCDIVEQKQSCVNQFCDRLGFLCLICCSWLIFLMRIPYTVQPCISFLWISQYLSRHCWIFYNFSVFVICDERWIAMCLLKLHLFAACGCLWWRCYVDCRITCISCCVAVVCYWLAPLGVSFGLASLRLCLWGASWKII